MILVDTALAKRAAEGRPIRIGMVGAGFQARGLARQLLKSVAGIELCAVANRCIEPARECYRQAGIEPVAVSGEREMSEALHRGEYVVTEHAELMARAPQLDAIVEITGSLEYAARAIMAAIGAGKHVVHMNAEIDGTVGPILKHHADKAGVIYSFSDGDQPGVQMNLYRFAMGLGMKPVLCGNIKGLHDPYRNPETQAAFAARWGQKPAMVASFADGTKISFEQAIVANGTGFKVAKRGMLGPDFSGGDPTKPLVPLEQAVAAFERHLSPDGPGLVDYVVGASPGPGVFVIGTTDDPQQRHYLELYKMGKGPYYCFSTPYHLCHFEVPNSIARAVLFRDAVLAPAAGPQVGVIACAKTDLGAGTEIAELGGFEVYGVAENIEAIRAENLLPIGLAVGARLTKAVGRDQPLRFSDLEFPADRLVDRLYAEQERLFATEALEKEGAL